MEKKNLPLFYFTLLICTFILCVFLLNFRLIFAPMKVALEDKDIKFSDFTEQIHIQYINKFSPRRLFVNLNGFITRGIGKKTLNYVDLMKNGMLIDYNVTHTDTSSLAQSINKFNSHLSENDIKFVYVQLPMKVDKNNELIYSGNINYANQNSNELLEKLDDDVTYIDMRDYIASTPSDIEKYFYRTDHHWNTYGGFEAFNVILNHLNSEFPEKNIDVSYADIENWNAKVYQDWFLGSLGKRTGSYFGGYDDITILTPNFNTNMSMYISNEKLFNCGKFEDVVIDSIYLDKPNYFNENPYWSYIGGDFPLVNHINHSATNDLKVLIIKDSFSLPVQAFLSTAVKELDVIDARIFSEATIAEYVDMTKPDIVIMAINPSVFDDTAYQDFGIDEANLHISESNKNEVLKHESFKISNSLGKDEIYEEILDNLDTNAKYTVSFGDIISKSANAHTASVAIYNATTKKIISSYVFDLKSRTENGYEWTFITPDIKNSQYSLIIYPGLITDTENELMEFKQLVVYKYE